MNSTGLLASRARSSARRSAGVTHSTDRTIGALRATHDALANVVTGMPDVQLVARSGATEWTVAEVLSHLGSGAEISLATLRAAVDGAAAPTQDFNPQVWDRWNSLTPPKQAADFLVHDDDLVAAVEALSTTQRHELRIDLGFLPAPLPVAGYLGMRLNEAAHHSWDVQVSTDPGAAISADTAELIAEHLATDLSFLLGSTGKADAIAHPAVVDIHGSGYAIVIDDAVSLTAAGPPATATFDGPLEAAIRLLAGRLGATHTPADVQVTGAVTLDDLRRVFPGY
jgi:uncharacterized protein (TIGR03083 family)